MSTVSFIIWLFRLTHWRYNYDCNDRLNHKVAVRTHAVLNDQETFFKRTVRLRPVVPREGFTLVTSRMQRKEKKKDLTLKLKVKVNFAAGF